MNNKLSLLVVGCLAIAASFTYVAGQSTSGPEEPGAKTRPTWVAYTGTITTGVVAIGAETTGIILTTENHGTVELDCGNSRSLLRQAEKLDGKTAVVTGVYREFPGVEIELRRVIKVQSIRAKGK